MCIQLLLQQNYIKKSFLFALRKQLYYHLTSLTSAVFVYIDTFVYLSFKLFLFLFQGYPNEAAAHVALSTVRQWMDKYGDEVGI